MEYDESPVPGPSGLGAAGVSTESLVSRSEASEPAVRRKEFRCEWIYCGLSFAAIGDLAKHVAQAHANPGSDGLYYCHWHGCGRVLQGFSARYKMIVHMRTHTQEKPYVCGYCNKGFARSENLKIHVRSHTGEKPYVCPYCDCRRTFSNSSDRFKHVKTHSERKPYVCKVINCGKRYTDPSSLRKHVKACQHFSPSLPVGETRSFENIPPNYLPSPIQEEVSTEMQSSPPKLNDSDENSPDFEKVVNNYLDWIKRGEELGPGRISPTIPPLEFDQLRLEDDDTPQSPLQDDEMALDLRL